MLVICNNCNKEFNKPKSAIAENNFCCKQCYFEYKRKDMKEVKCIICGKTEFVSPSRANNYEVCSKKCQSTYKKSLVENNARCPICYKDFHVKPSKLKKIKNPCCSLECNIILRKTTMKGENNHQFGLTGSVNSSFKNGERITNYGYKLILTNNHPFNKDNYYPGHRLIAEKYLLNNDEDFVIINNKKYLKPERVVHHIDFDKLNNVPGNLHIFKNLILHTLYHNLYDTHKFTLAEFYNYYNTYLYNLYENKEWLYDNYINKRISISKIAETSKSSWSTVNKKLLEYDILKRINIKR